MKNTLLALIVALVASLFAVMPQSVYADSVWPEQVSKESGLRYVIYTVRRGDKLEHIARNHSSDKYQISVAGIVELNYIQNPHRILIGQKLRLPMHYEKEAQAVVPATVQAAVEAAVAPKEAALVKTKRTELALGALLMLTITFLAYLIFLYIPNKIHVQKSAETEPNNEPVKPERFLSHPDEIKALLPKCTGQEIADILESEFVEIPRGPGSTATNKVKVKNIPDLMKKYPELLSRLPVLWREHLATKMETNHIRIET